MENKLKSGTPTFEFIHGYENTVIPDLERALLSGHNINLLGLRGQAKTKLARQLIFLLDEWVPIIKGEWPITALLGAIGLPAGIALVDLLHKHHNNPERLSGSKFLALRFQALNGFGLSFGLALAPIFGINIIKTFEKSAKKQL